LVALVYSKVVAGLEAIAFQADLSRVRLKGLVFDLEDFEADLQGGAVVLKALALSLQFGSLLSALLKSVLLAVKALLKLIPLAFKGSGLYRHLLQSLFKIRLTPQMVSQLGFEVKAAFLLNPNLCVELVALVYSKVVAGLEAVAFLADLGRVRLESLVLDLEIFEADLQGSAVLLKALALRLKFNPLLSALLKGVHLAVMAQL
jgi:hypothetical protein